MLLLVALLVGSVSAWGQAAVNTVLWSEDWTGSTTANSGSNSATPSANYGNGTTVYGSGTVTYTQSANSVYVRNEEYAGGEKPELMLSRGNTWTISNIPTGGAVDLTLTYKSNNAKSSVTCSTSGTSVSGSSTSYTITTGGAETITLVFGCSGNTRIDDVSLTVKTAGASKTNVGTFSTISDQAVTKGSSIDFDPSDYYTNDDGVTGTTTFTVTPTSGDIYYSEGKIYATTYGSQEFTVTATPADADKSKYKAVSTTFTANCADTRTAPTFNLSATSINLKVNETSNAVFLTTNSDGTVSFACEDAHVTLTGTGNSRTISANAAGNYTVNVSVTGSDTYKDAAGTITVNVTKKATTMVLTPTFTSKDLKDANSGSVTGVPQYNSTDVEGATVSYESSDTKVATIASNGTITFKKAGTTTITVSYEGDDEYTACEAEYELTLVDTRPQETEVEISLNNTFFGISVITSWQTGDPTTATGTLNNVSVTYSKGTSSYFYCNANKVRFYTGNAFTVEAPSGYHIISVDMNATISTATPTGTISSDTWTGDASSVSFTFDNKTDLTSITVTLAPTVTISDKKYATFASDHDLDFSGVSGLYAYTATVAGSVITFNRVTEAKAGEGLLLYANVNENTTYSIPVSKDNPSAVSGNKLKRGTGAAVASTDDGGATYNYVLSSKGEGDVNFYRANGNTVPTSKAYLKNIPTTTTSKFFLPTGEDDTDGIKSVQGSRFTVNGEAYNLAGQKVSESYKGIVIVNGKKMIRK